MRPPFSPARSPGERAPTPPPSEPRPAPGQEKGGPRPPPSGHRPAPAEAVTLPNGLRLLLLDVPGGMVHVRMLVECGFDDETPPSSPGPTTLQAAHALEHHQAGWTSTTHHPTAAVVARELEQRGVSSNATTSSKTTVYWMEGPTQSAPHFVSVFAHAFADFAVDPTTVEPEAKAVEQELRQRWKDDPWDDADQRWSKLVYGKAHVRASTTDEHLASARRVARDVGALLAFRRRFYRPSSMVCVLAGPRAALGERLERGLRTTLSRLADASGGSRDGRAAARAARYQPPSLAPLLRVRVPLYLTPARVSSARVTVRYALARDDVVASAPSRAPAEGLRLFARVLSRGVASRLFHRLRTELGLVYNVSAAAVVDAVQPAMSHLLVTTTCEPKRSVLSSVVREVRALVEDPQLTHDEVRRLVAHVETRRARRAQDASPAAEVSDRAARYLWSGRDDGAASDGRESVFDLRVRLARNGLRDDDARPRLRTPPLVLVAMAAR